MSPPAGYDESYHVFCHRRRLKVEIERSHCLRKVDIRGSISCPWCVRPSLFKDALPQRVRDPKTGHAQPENVTFYPGLTANEGIEISLYRGCLGGGHCHHGAPVPLLRAQALCEVFLFPRRRLPPMASTSSKHLFRECLPAARWHCRCTLRIRQSCAASESSQASPTRAQIRALLVAARVLRGFECMDGAGPFGGAGGAAFSIAKTADAAAVPGAIDDPAVHLPSAKDLAVFRI